MRTSALILACSSSHRRRSSSSRSNRSFLAWWYVVKPPPCVQVVFPPAPSSTVTTRVADAGQQLAVVADEQHRLRRLPQRLLEPQLAGHVEVVVRLVEHQHLVRAAEQRLEHHPLLLAAGERAHLAPLRLLERDADRRDRAGVPQDLGLVAAGVGPVGQGLRVAHLGALVVALHHQQLGLLQRLGGRAHGGRRDRDAAGRAPTSSRAPSPRTGASRRGRRTGRSSPRAGRCRRPPGAAASSCRRRWHRPARPWRRRPTRNEMSDSRHRPSGR